MTEAEGLLKRIEKLERDNSRLRSGFLILLLLAAWVMVVGQSSVPETITAHRFVVLDDGGKERAWLIGADGGPALIFGDLNGQSTFFLTSTIEGPRMMFYDKSGKQQIEMIASSQGSQFTMGANGDGAGATMSVLNEGVSMQFRGKDGAEVLRLP